MSCEPQTPPCLGWGEGDENLLYRKSLDWLKIAQKLSNKAASALVKELLHKKQIILVTVNLSLLAHSEANFVFHMKSM